MYEMAFLSRFLQHALKLNKKGLSKTFTLNNHLLYQGRSINTVVSKLEDITINDVLDICEKRTVRVTWADNITCEFPHIYLRDNCQCPICFHSPTKHRQLDLVKSIDFEIEAKNVKHVVEKDAIIVNWPDNHQSVFQGSWLRARKFGETWDTAHSSTLHEIQSLAWTSSQMIENMPVIDYKQLMTSEKTLIEHLQNLFIRGLSVIREAPAESGILYELVKRVSHKYMRKTHYGEIFTVRNKPSPSNIAYTAVGLELHLDLPYLSYQPGIQHLHCIEQSEGENCGMSLFVDGFRVAEEIKNTNPNAFDILTKVKFKFNDVGRDIYGDFNLQYERPLIGLDSYGNVETIIYNNPVRSSFINAPSEAIQDCYKAFYVFATSLNSDILKYKMSPGDIICFDNKRVLHGRTAFDPITSARWLEGCYIDWDEARSIYRVTRERMKSY